MKVRPLSTPAWGFILPVLLMLGFAPALAVAEEPEPAPAKDGPIEGDAVKGARVYAMNCIACHGRDGDGEGPLAKAFDPKPADFTNAKRMAELSDKYFLTIIRDGGPTVGKCMEMGAWKHTLSETDIHDVAAYVKAIHKRPPPRLRPRR